MSDASNEDELSFAQQEWQRVHERREHAFPGSERAENNPQPKNVVGLSLSGGGLRSAMFNDGFLQGLSHTGLLRYVDYLCSVSGGGYIAAHLATHADKNSANGFHDDVQPDDDQERWALGRSPTTGHVDANRLSGVGRYLASKIAIAPSFLWSLLLSLLVFVGLTGVVATLLALFWRSFDDPMFRVLLRDVLDFKFGGELAIAFYPALLVLIVWLSLCVLGWFRNSPHQLVVNRTGLILFLAAILVSIAVFIGNGKTDASRSGSASIQLNHYAQWLVIVAAALQLFAFLGRDMLFRSERDESKYWQKAVQKFATSGVLIFACFAMVHWMVRENISGYTTHRSPYIVRGEVSNWDLLQRLSVAYQQWDKSKREAEKDDTVNISNWDLLQRLSVAYQQWDKSKTDAKKDNAGNISSLIKAANGTKNISVSIDVAKSGINLSDAWEQHQLIHPLVPLTADKLTYTRSDPASPAAPPTTAWTFWQRMAGAVQAYVYTRFTPDESNFKPLKATESRFNKKPESIYDFYMLANYRWFQQRELLEQFNTDIERESYTTFLLGLAEENSVDLGESASTLLKTQTDQRRLANAATDDDDLSRRRTASVNRKLLLEIYPKSIQDIAVPSTLVVPPYDQAARWRWLVGWWTMLCVGICLSAIQNQTSTLYVYYRNRLSKLFLDPERDSDLTPDDRTKRLHQLRPTEDGLPHPLFLATRMKPCIIEGSYHVQNRPFVFSPIYCGDIETESFKTEEIGLPGVGQSPLLVGDAVTISGAAVTPFMTDNRALSIVLSLFGGGLGQWLIRRYRLHDDNVPAVSLRSLPWLGTLVCLGAFGVLFAGWHQFGFAFSIFVIATLSLAAVYIAKENYSGICQFLVAMFAPPRVTAEEAAKSAYNNDSVSRCKPSGSIGHIADGGFYDYLGVSELFRRKCSLIVVSDAGANLGNNPLGPLAKMCTNAAAQFGVRIFDLDHEAPIDFGRLEIDETVENERVVHQPYIVARIRYADNSEGLLVYCQMAITDSDPIEIQQIRHRFPSFPDEPTTNQFYTDDQVAAYRHLGHHIATRMSREVHRWTAQDIKKDVQTTATQPLFDVVRRRLLTAYRLACYQERTYKAADLFSEAIWSSAQTCTCRSFGRTMDSELLDNDLQDGATDSRRSLSENWLRAYENNGDIRAKYRHAVLRDINSTADKVTSACADIWHEIMDQRLSYAARKKREPRVDDKDLMAGHLAAIAVACHEVHAGRPNAIFQVGGREKLVAMTSKLRDVLIDAHPNEEELRALTSVHTPLDEASLKLSVKQCIGEIVELEKCTFQGSERVTTVSFAQCLVMMWGQLSEEQCGPIETSATSFKTIAGRIREEGVELAASKVRIWLERGPREKNLSNVVVGLENAWCITYLPPNMIERSKKVRRRKKKDTRIRKKTAR